MKLTFPTLCAAMLTLTPLVAGPASAAPPATAQPASTSSMTLSLTGSQAGADALGDLVPVQSRRYPYDRSGAFRPGATPPRYDNRGRRHHSHRPPARPQSRGPDLGSAIVGAIVGGVIVNQLQQSNQYHPPAPQQHGSYLSRNHIDWCHNRWRSYRVSDNSYQPYNGPRRVCVSPFGPS